MSFMEIGAVETVHYFKDVHTVMLQPHVLYFLSDLYEILGRKSSLNAWELCEHDVSESHTLSGA
jgi:hypothetical protein